MWPVSAVDDGTGVISCCCWKTPYGDPQLNTLPLLSGKFIHSSTLTSLLWVGCTSFVALSVCMYS